MQDKKWMSGLLESLSSLLESQSGLLGRTPFSAVIEAERLVRKVVRETATQRKTGITSIPAPALTTHAYNKKGDRYRAYLAIKCWRCYAYWYGTSFI
jgi:hypothetical protein